MNAMDMVQGWRKTLNSIFGRLHAHRIKAMAALSWAIAFCAHCHSGKIAAVMPGRAKLASHRRQVERFLANSAIDVAAVMDLLAGSILRQWPRPHLVLILDETSRTVRPRRDVDPPRGNSVCCIKLSVGYRKRALPVAFECYRTRRTQPRGVVRRVLSLLEHAAALVPENCQVTLLADRGLCWPKIVDFCHAHHWHYVLRLQRQTAIRRHNADGSMTTVYAGDLVKHRDQFQFVDDAEVFKTSGWRNANVTAVWEERCKEPWLLVSDLPSSYARCRQYAKRCWCEEMHRDEKSSGFQWRSSRVEDPAHVQRLLLLMALAMLLAISIGSSVLKQGLRKQIEPRLRRLNSVFQLGLLWLRHCITNASDEIDLRVHLYPP